MKKIIISLLFLWLCATASKAQQPNTFKYDVQMNKNLTIVGNILNQGLRNSLDSTVKLFLNQTISGVKKYTDSLIIRKNAIDTAHIFKADGMVQIGSTRPIIETGSNNTFRAVVHIPQPSYGTNGKTNVLMDAFLIGNRIDNTQYSPSKYFRVNLGQGNASGDWGAVNSNNSLIHINSTTSSIIRLSAQGQGAEISSGTTQPMLLIRTMEDGGSIAIQSYKNPHSGGGIEYRASVNGAWHSHKFFNGLTELMRLTTSNRSDGIVGPSTNAVGSLLLGNVADQFNAKLLVESNNQGIRNTRLTTTQRNAVAWNNGSDVGMVIYCTDCTATDGSTGVSQTWNGTTWKNHY